MEEWKPRTYPFLAMVKHKRGIPCLTQEQVNTIQDLYWKQGMTVGQIINHMRLTCNYMAVNRAANKTYSTAGRQYKSKLTPEKLEKMIKLREEEGLTVAILSERFKISKSLINRAFRKMGVSKAVPRQ
jgi:hypothetical protein